MGGGPTDDKPAVTLETPRDLDRVSSFLNIRVKDIEAVYAEWSARGAQFLTPPKQHQYEIRCYIRDPDGHLIEVGQTTDPEGDWTPPQWLSSTAGGEPGSDAGQCSSRSANRGTLSVRVFAVTIQVEAGARTSPSAANSARPSRRAAWTCSCR